MEYNYESGQHNYEDLASGRVLYNARGTTAFPVRLASELVQRCFYQLEQKGVQGPYTLYDPCCGGGYLLTVLGLLHGDRIDSVYASDINAEVLDVARKNISLLTPMGMERRRRELIDMAEKFGKPSHREALASLDMLAGGLVYSQVKQTLVFQADATAMPAAEAPRGVHLVITDLPYGSLVDWQGASDDPVTDTLSNLHRLLAPGQSIVAVIADKGQKLKHERFRRLQHFKVGKRQVALMEPLDERAGE